MSQQLQGLIDKIKKEGIEEAETHARQREEEAQKKADDIVAQAKQKAEEIVRQARQEEERIKDSTHRALEQTARDALLSLRKDIQQMFNQVVAQDVKDVLSGDQLAAVIQKAVGAYMESAAKTEVLVTVSEEDLKKIKNTALAGLKDKIKGSVTFQAGSDVKAGFTVSFDEGKSCFDFTDAGLVGYMSGYLNKDVSSLLQGITPAK